MFYPYFRGRQYELIALREMLLNQNYSKNVIPIVEPVKVSSTLISTIQAYIDEKRDIILVMNPTVGDFISELNIKKEYAAQYNKLLESSYVNFCFLLSDKKDISVVLKNKDYGHLLQTKKNYLYCPDYDSLKKIDLFKETIAIEGCLISEHYSLCDKINENKIFLKNRFKKQKRNSDYLDNEDEFYSDDHLTYSNNYKGFGDYSVIGDDYTDSGFAPYAVAIHMVYFDDGKLLRIHHFVSDRTDDINDTPGKFGEALEKLISFPKLREYKTEAYKTLCEYHEKGLYSGLGIVKKLSIMHHLELISLFLDGKVK